MCSLWDQFSIPNNPKQRSELSNTGFSDWLRFRFRFISFAARRLNITENEKKYNMRCKRQSAVSSAIAIVLCGYIMIGLWMHRDAIGLLVLVIVNDEPMCRPTFSLLPVYDKMKLPFVTSQPISLFSTFSITPSPFHFNSKLTFLVNRFHHIYTVN